MLTGGDADRRSCSPLLMLVLMLVLVLVLVLSRIIGLRPGDRWQCGGVECPKTKNLAVARFWWGVSDYDGEGMAAMADGGLKRGAIRVVFIPASAGYGNSSSGPGCAPADRRDPAGSLPPGPGRTPRRWRPPAAQSVRRCALPPIGAARSR